MDKITKESSNFPLGRYFNYSYMLTRWFHTKCLEKKMQRIPKKIQSDMLRVAAESLIILKLVYGSGSKLVECRYIKWNSCTWELLPWFIELPLPFPIGKWSLIW